MDYEKNDQVFFHLRTDICSSLVKFIKESTYLTIKKSGNIINMMIDYIELLKHINLTM